MSLEKKTPFKVSKRISNQFEVDFIQEMFTSIANKKLVKKTFIFIQFWSIEI